MVDGECMSLGSLWLKIKSGLKPNVWVVVKFSSKAYCKAAKEGRTEINPECSLG